MLAMQVAICPRRTPAFNSADLANICTICLLHSSIGNELHRCCLAEKFEDGPHLRLRYHWSRLKGIQPCLRREVAA